MNAGTFAGAGHFEQSALAFVLVAEVDPEPLIVSLHLHYHYDAFHFQAFSDTR